MLEKNKKNDKKVLPLKIIPTCGKYSTSLSQIISIRRGVSVLFMFTFQSEQINSAGFLPDFLLWSLTRPAMRMLKIFSRFITVYHIHPSFPSRIHVNRNIYNFQPYSYDETCLQCTKIVFQATTKKNSRKFHFISRIMFKFYILHISPSSVFKQWLVWNAILHYFIEVNIDCQNTFDKLRHFVAYLFLILVYLIQMVAMILILNISKLPIQISQD